MKTIIIESVSNGWIVIERFADIGITRQPIAVYNNLSDLADDLPRLLEVHGPTAQYNDQYTSNPPPLAPRDSDGGNTGL